MINRYVGSGADQTLVSAKNFREAMEEKVLADESSLKIAIARAQGEIRKLELYRSRLGLEAQEVQGGQALSEISALGRLIQRWNSQLAHLGVQETEARTYRWQEDKGKEETRRYVASVEAALAEGKEQTQAIKALHDVLGEVETAFSLCEMVISKAQVQRRPEAIPTVKVDSIIGRFEAILAGIRDKLPESEVRDATRKLERLKAYRAEVSGIAGRLSHEQEVSAYETREKSEGVTYFRAHLPTEVREILSPRDVSGLEEKAFTGVNGAKKAIATALRIAGKRSPERMRAFLGR